MNFQLLTCRYRLSYDWIQVSLLLCLRSYFKDFVRRERKPQSHQSIKISLILIISHLFLLAFLLHNLIQSSSYIFQILPVLKNTFFTLFAFNHFRLLFSCYRVVVATWILTWEATQFNLIYMFHGFKSIRFCFQSSEKFLVLV
jgi:hypothetical protein